MLRPGLAWSHGVGEPNALTGGARLRPEMWLAFELDGVKAVWTL